MSSYEYVGKKNSLQFNIFVEFYLMSFQNDYLEYFGVGSSFY